MLDQPLLEHAVQSWQSQLKNMIKTPQALFEALNLPEALLPAAELAAKQFPVRATASYLARIKLGDIHDPLLKQILPLGKELQITPGYVHDALAEKKFNPLPGVLHKYPNRILLLLGSCAIHCRYCFRRAFPYDENTPGRAGFEQYHQYIVTHPEINEVILSGGDPLLTPDHLLEELIQLLASIPHLSTIRLHTRLPIVLPARLTENLLEALTGTRLQCVMVTHTNHPNEINHEVSAAVQSFKGKITLLNQSVLLKDINDNAETLNTLHQRLFQTGILPYYLHLPDKVAGTEHFMIKDDVALEIYKQLQTISSGYLVPKLVREVPGSPAKQFII